MNKLFKNVKNFLLISILSVAALPVSIFSMFVISEIIMRL